MVQLCISPPLPPPPIYIPNLSFIFRNYSICFNPSITDILMWMWCGHSVNAFIHAGYSLSNRGEEHGGQHGQQDGKMASPYKPKRQPCKPPFKSKRQPRASPVSLRIIHSSHTRENTFASNIFQICHAFPLIAKWKRNIFFAFLLSILLHHICLLGALFFFHENL